MEDANNGCGYFTQGKPNRYKPNHERVPLVRYHDDADGVANVILKEDYSSVFKEE